jgi:hypothetical protein
MNKLSENKDLCLSLLDRGAWKHSWHLPLTCHGVDWRHTKTRDKLKEEVAEAMKEAHRLIVLAGKVEKLLNFETSEEEEFRECFLSEFQEF